MKEQIVCDTNVFYNLGVDPSIFEDTEKELIVNYVNIKELSETPNLIDKFELVQNAIKALQKFQSVKIVESPFEYMMDVESEKTIIDDIYSAFSLLIKFDPEHTLDTDYKEKIEKNLEVKVKFNDYCNQLAKHVRQNIKTTTNKKSHRRIDTQPLAKQFIISLLNRKYSVNDIDINWSKLDLFLFVLDSYFKEIELTPQMKFDKNDWLDLFQLVYVTPERKFWTFERKGWYKAIEGSPEYSKYLYKK